MELTCRHGSVGCAQPLCCGGVDEPLDLVPQQCRGAAPAQAPSTSSTCPHQTQERGTPGVPYVAALKAMVSACLKAAAGHSVDSFAPAFPGLGCRTHSALTSAQQQPGLHSLPGSRACSAESGGRRTDLGPVASAQRRAGQGGPQRSPLLGSCDFLTARTCPWRGRSLPNLGVWLQHP